MIAEADARRDAGPHVVDVLALLALWLVVVVVVDPRGDFPLNDDWAYAIAVRRLLDEGAFRPPGWAGMTLLSQALWGAAVSAVVGFSHTALRASTLLLGGAAVVGTYLLARALRATRPLALLAALTLAVNPLFVALAHTFMTDVPMLAMMLFALLGFARALASGSRLGWAAGTAATIAALLCRQPAIVPAFGFAAAAGLCPLVRRRWLAFAALSVGLAGAALSIFQQVMQARGALPAAYWSHHDFLLRLWQAPRSALSLVAGNCGAALAYTGLLLLPLLIAGIPGWRATQRSWWRASGVIAGASLVVAALALWSSRRPMPMRGNVLIQSGLGPITLNDWYIRGLANDAPLPTPFWWTVTVVAALGAALLVAGSAAALARVWHQRRNPAASSEPARALLLATALLYLGITCVTVQFDRYLLPLVPILGVTLLPAADDGRAPGRWTWLAAALPLLLLATYATAGTHDYLAWNRARWQALQQLADEGIEARRIDGGLEFNAPRFYIEGSNPSSGSGRSWWWVADDEYLIAMGPVPGYDVARAITYRRWLPPGTGTIAVLHRHPR